MKRASEEISPWRLQSSYGANFKTVGLKTAEIKYEAEEEVYYKNQISESELL